MSETDRITNDLKMRYGLKDVKITHHSASANECRFTTSSKMAFATDNKTEETGMLIDGKYWPSPKIMAGTMIDGKLRVFNIFENYGSPHVIIHDNDIEETKTLSCFLVFLVDVSYDYDPYPVVLLCSLEGHLFDKECVFKPKYTVHAEL